MDFSQINDIQINGKKLMMILRANSLSGLGYYWRRHPEYPYLTFAVCFKRTEIGDGKHVSGTHIREGMQFCFGFTDKNKLLVPLDPDTSQFLNWSALSDMGVEIINSQTARKQIDTIGTNGLIIMGEYYESNGSKVNYEYVIRAYGVKNKTDHINFYNRIQTTKQYRNMGDNLTYAGTTYHDMKEWEISDAEWSVTTEEEGKIPLYGHSSDKKSFLSGVKQIGKIDTHPRRILLKSGTIDYWPTSYYGFSPIDTPIKVPNGTPLITLDGKKGATKVVSVRDNFSQYRAAYSGSKPYISTYMKIDCKSQSLGINETWGLYVGVTLKK